MKALSFIDIELIDLSFYFNSDGDSSFVQNERSSQNECIDKCSFHCLVFNRFSSPFFFRQFCCCYCVFFLCTFGAKYICFFFLLLTSTLWPFGKWPYVPNDSLSSATFNRFFFLSKKLFLEPCILLYFPFDGP